MKRILLSVLFVGLLASCESKLDKKIPDSWLVGAVANIKTTVKKTDSWVKATGSVPFNVKRDQVRPSLLAVLKVLLKEYPNEKLTIVELGPDPEMAKEGSLVGRATYENGIIKLVYAVPSEEQMEKHNAKIGQLEPAGFTDYTTPPTRFEKNDNPRLFVPDETTFQNSKKIYLMVSNKKYIKDDVEQRYKAVSKIVGLPVREVKHRYLFFYLYYGMGLGEGRGVDIL